MTRLVDVPTVKDHEDLARAVVSSTEAKLSRVLGVPASVFQYLGNFELSVDRVSRMTPREAVRHGKLIASERGSNRNFYGWAILRRPKVLDADCDCRKSPMFDNLWHADIQMPEATANDDDLHHEYAARLARRSCWRDSSDA